MDRKDVIKLMHEKGKTVCMRRDAFARWLKALRSGNYTQCRNRLSDGAGYCCLGLEQVSHTGVLVDVGEEIPSVNYKHANEVIYLSKYGMATSDPWLGSHSAAEANDTGSTFCEIADMLETCYMEWPAATI